jgi:hypothetical protein
MGLQSRVDTHQRFFTQYTRLTPTSIGHDPAHLLHCVKHDLTRNIGSLMKEISEETEYAFNSNLGECDGKLNVHLQASIVP